MENVYPKREILKKTSLKIAAPFCKKKPPLECAFGVRFVKKKNASPRDCFWIQIIEGKKGLPKRVFLKSDF